MNALTRRELPVLKIRTWLVVSTTKLMARGLFNYASTYQTPQSNFQIFSSNMCLLLTLSGSCKKLDRTNGVV